MCRGVSLGFFLGLARQMAATIPQASLGRTVSTLQMNVSNDAM